jgi:hypothetical protein
MKPKVTLILIVIALLLGGIVALDYFKGATTEEAEARRKKVFDFKVADVTRLEFARTNGTVVVEKSGEQWEMRQPVAARASKWEMERLLEALEELPRQRTLTPKDLRDVDKKEFGFDSPQLRVALQTRTGTVSAAFGNENPTRESVYVQLADRPEVIVAPRRILDVFARKVEDLRDRTVLDFSPWAAQRLEIRAGARVLEFAKAAGTTALDVRWNLVRPIATRADARRVQDLVHTLNGLRALEFVSDDPKDVPLYGLAEPQMEIIVIAGDDPPKTLLIGSPKRDDPSRVYAKRKLLNPIFTISADVVQQFSLPINEVRDRKLLDFDGNEVASIEILRDGARILAEKSGGRWMMAQPESAPADIDAVRRLLKALDDARIAEFVTDVATDLDQFGLATPPIQITLRKSGEISINGEPPLAQLLLGGIDAERNLRFARRAEDPFIFGIGPEVVDALPRAWLDWRDKNVATLSLPAIQRLVVERADGTPRVVAEKNEVGAWKLIEPAGAEMDNDALLDTLAAFLPLRARRFVAPVDENLADFGLAPAEITVAVTTNGVEHKLLLGKILVPPLRYALWKDVPLVFEMDATAVTRPLALETGEPFAEPATEEIVTPPVEAESQESD